MLKYFNSLNCHKVQHTGWSGIYVKLKIFSTKFYVRPVPAALIDPHLLYSRLLVGLNEDDCAI